VEAAVLFSPKGVELFFPSYVGKKKKVRAVSSFSHSGDAFESRRRVHLLPRLVGAGKGWSPFFLLLVEDWEISLFPLILPPCPSKPRPPF